jgi:hypothetical protein
MNSNPEPTDVGPAVGGNLPVSETDKQQVVHLLQTAFDDGRLTLDELHSRRTEAEQAQTFDDLIPLTRDLVDLDEARTYTVSASPSSPSSSAGEPRKGDPGDESGSLFAVFGGASRKGNWTVPAQLSLWAVFGGTEVDFTQATFTSDVVELSIVAAFGGVEVIVPEHAKIIERSTGGMFGGAEVKHSERIDPDLPTFIVSGFFLFGGAEVRPPKKKRN